MLFTLDSFQNNEQKIQHIVKLSPKGYLIAFSAKTLEGVQNVYKDFISLYGKQYAIKKKHIAYSTKLHGVNDANLECVFQYVLISNKYVQKNI